MDEERYAREISDEDDASPSYDLSILSADKLKPHIPLDSHC